ncbi:carbohydrate esterase family 4 protein [Trichoderma evansii]
MTNSPWPNGAQAAVSFTADNLGEAQELNSGTWPKNKPVGHHSSVTEALPRMLKIFDESDVKATFFFETWSLGVYPTVGRDIINRGHELAWHGYQHETWAKLSPTEEEAIFDKSFTNAKNLEINYAGFRPPGGQVNGATYDYLHKYGVRYISPAAERVAIVRDIVILPFHWKTTDAYFYMNELSGLRQFYGSEEDTLDPKALKDHFLHQLEDAVRSNAYISFLFHPILQTSEEKLLAMREVVELVAKDPRIWCAPCNQVADWVIQHPESFPTDPSWINATW